MTKLIKRRIVPFLLLLVLCIGMVPTAFADAEITVTDNAASDSTTQEDSQHNADIVVVPNEESEDLISESIQPGVDSSPSESTSPDSGSSSSESIPQSTSGSSASASDLSAESLPQSAVSSSSASGLGNNSENAAEPEGGSTSIPTDEGTKQDAFTPVTIVSRNGISLFASAPDEGKLQWKYNPGYQYDANQGNGSVNLETWPTATINGRVAYCVEPENLNTHGSKPYGTIQYDQLSSAQVYSIGYAMLYGAQDLSNIPYHIATQTIIWEITRGYMDLESYTCINKGIYNAVIGYNPSTVPYYEQILAQMRAHKEVPSFAHFSSTLAPVHKVPGIPGEYKLDLMNTNPNCDLSDFNFSDQAGVTFTKENQTLHVASSAAISAGTLFSSFKGSLGETNSLIYWCSLDGEDQIRATADVLDPVPAYFRLSTEDVGQYQITIVKLESGTNIPLAGAQFEIRHTEKGTLGTYTTDGSGRLTVSVPWQGTYICTEISPPVNHKLDAEPKKEIVISTEHPSGELTYHNERYASIQITKLDARTQTPISGVSFEISERGGDKVQTVTTGASGVAVLENVQPDAWYEIREVSCPPGYILDPTSHIVQVKAGQITEITLENYAKPSIEILKVDADDPSIKLSNVTFRIARRGSKDYQDIVTGSDGVARLTGIDIDEDGEYFTVREIIAANGYILNDQEFTVEVKPGQVTTMTVENRKKPSLELMKIDSITKEPLPYATFRLEYVDGRKIGTFQSDSEGRVHLSQLDPGRVSITEVSSPDGYLLDDKPREVLLEPGKTASLTVENTPASPLIIKKLSTDGTPLAGAKIRVTRMDGSLVGDFVTGRGGYITVPNVEPGWFICEELEAPAGFQLDNTPKKIELKRGEPAILELENSPLPGLQIRKVSENGIPIAGVSITIQYKTGEVVGTYKTDAAGLISLPDLEPGWYTCYESQTVPGFLLDMTPQDVLLEEGKVATLTFVNKAVPGLTILKKDSISGKGIGGVEIELRWETGELIGTYTTDSTGRIYAPLEAEKTVVAREVKTLPEYRLDPTERSVTLESGKANELIFENDPYPYLIIQKIDRSTKEPLSGVQFKISDDLGHEVGTYTTSATGRIVLTGINEGHYQVQEISPAPSYRPDNTVYDVYLSWGKTTTITIKNEKLASFLLKKVDKETGEPIPNVTFLIYDAQTNQLIGEYTTDDQGQILFEENLLPEKIKIKEIRAEGYVVDPDDIRTVKLESGKLIDLVWENQPERGQIQIVKQSAEYNDTTKLPEGNALEGAVFEIFNLNNEVLDTITTNERGIATSKPLPLQVVGIREVQAPEHYLLNGKVFWAEIKKHGDVVKFVVENANEEIGVDVKKFGNIEAMPGDTIRYDFSDIRNESNVPLDNFYWRDILPTDAVTLRIISTGTWNEELKYTIYYKTNLVSEERALAERLSTSTNNTIDCSASAVKLKAGEVITEIRFDFGTVQPGFEPLTNPYITCLVHPDLPHEYRFKNCTDVGGERGDEWVIDKDCWVTVIYAVPKGKLPKTGN